MLAEDTDSGAHRKNGRPVAHPRPLTGTDSRFAREAPSKPDTRTDSLRESSGRSSRAVRSGCHSADTGPALGPPARNRRRSSRHRRSVRRPRTARRRSRHPPDSSPATGTPLERGRYSRPILRSWDSRSIPSSCETFMSRQEQLEHGLQSRGGLEARLGCLCTRAFSYAPLELISSYLLGAI